MIVYYDFYYSVSSVYWWFYNQFTQFCYVPMITIVACVCLVVANNFHKISCQLYLLFCLQTHSYINKLRFRRLVFTFKSLIVLLIMLKKDDCNKKVEDNIVK